MRDTGKDNIDTMHNWFGINGDIRTKNPMTTTEFSNLLDKFELEFLGVIKYSEFSDEDYED